MEKYERLRRARLSAGYETVTRAAKALGVKVPTYTHHENGTRDFDAETAEFYARRFKTSPEWLTFERGDPPKVASFDREDRGTVRTTDGMAEPAPTGRDQLQALWRRLSEPQRLRLIAFAEGMLAEQAPPPPAAAPPPQAAAPTETVTSRLKPRPAIDTIGGHRPPHYYLAEWMDHRNMEPVDLVKRLPTWELEDLQRVLAGRFPPPDDLIHYAAKALRASEEELQQLPPPRAKPAAKGGKRQSTRR
jgi:transcriptional regulator with XRE-family HTH domain